MEKTVQITIASMQFQVTESAYTLLRSYLDRLTAHFGTTSESSEIIRDIETRIAEKFIDAKHKLVTESDVRAVIAEIGEASAFSDTMTEQAPIQEEKPARKRLYRNMDDAYLGGVASGIAAYFDIDPLWVRLAFIVFVFMSGFGILAYLLLWLLVPEARSASQKLEMNGKAVTLESIAQTVKDRLEETEKSGALTRMARAIDTISRRLFSIIGRIIGAVLTLGSFFAIIGTSVLLGVILLNWNAPWNDIPHKEVISTTLLKAILIAGYTAIIIPIILVFSLGYRWMTSRALLSATVGFGLMGIWALSLVSSGVLATKIVGDYYAYTSSSPEYAQTFNEVAVAEFHTLNIEHARVTFKVADTYSVRISGRKIDLGNATTSIKDGVLTVASVRDERPCLFCGRSTPTVVVSAPRLDTIAIRSGWLSFEDLRVPNMNIDARSSTLSGTAIIPSVYLTLESSWAGVEFVSRDIRVDARNARVELEGSTDTLYVEARRSSVGAESLKAQEATIDAEFSSVQVRADKTFTIQSDRNSDVQNAGSAAGVSEASTEAEGEN